MPTVRIAAPVDTVGGPVDQPVPPTPDRWVGDELAECLQQFLTARADERTMRRAQQALDLWHDRFQTPVRTAG
jgi:hypothetical protein